MQRSLSSPKHRAATPSPSASSSPIHTRKATTSASTGSTMKRPRSILRSRAPARRCRPDHEQAHRDAARAEKVISVIAELEELEAAIVGARVAADTLRFAAYGERADDPDLREVPSGI